MPTWPSTGVCRFMHLNPHLTMLWLYNSLLSVVRALQIISTRALEYSSKGEKGLKTTHPYAAPAVMFQPNANLPTRQSSIHPPFTPSPLPQPRKLIIPIKPPALPIQRLQHLRRSQIPISIALPKLANIPLQAKIIAEIPSASARLTRAVDPIAVVFEDSSPTVRDGLWLKVVR